MKVLNRLPVVCFLIFITLLAYNANAQQTDRSAHEYYWAEMIGGYGTFGGISVGASINYRREQLLIMILADGQINDLFFTEGKYISEVGLLAGMTNPADDTKTYRSLSSGLAFTTRKKCVDNCGIFEGKSVWETKTVIGLPLQARIGWRPLPFLGIGLAGMANINITEMFGSINLNVQVGKVR